MATPLGAMMLQRRRTGRVPYRDLLYGSRGDTITATNDDGSIASITGGNPMPTSANEDTSFRETPGYEFRRDQGAEVVGNDMTSRGLRLSGRALKELERFGQDYGAGEYQNVFNRRAVIAGLNPVSATNLNMATGNFANAGSSILQNLGQGLSSSYLQRGAGQNNAVQGGLSNYLFYNYLNR